METKNVNENQTQESAWKSFKLLMQLIFILICVIISLIWIASLPATVFLLILIIVDLSKQK